MEIGKGGGGAGVLGAGGVIAGMEGGTTGAGSLRFFPITGTRDNE